MEWENLEYPVLPVKWGRPIVCFFWKNDFHGPNEIQIRNVIVVDKNVWNISILLMWWIIIFQVFFLIISLYFSVDISLMNVQ